MSFNVTQCPACESTFNTNSRVLAVAAGKVRCGACLNVFEAIDNFLITDEDDLDTTQGESVFVGNNPQEYFDPSRFLTRSALREAQHADSSSADPSAEQYLHHELEQSETGTEEFFTTIAEGLQGPDGPAISDAVASPEHETQIEETQQDLLAAEPAAGIDDAFEEEILTSFSEQLEIDEEAESVAATQSETEPNARAAERAQEARVATQEPQATETGPEPEAPPQEPKDRSVGLALSASFSFGHLKTPKVSPEEPEPAAHQDDEANVPSQETIAALAAEPEIEFPEDDTLQFLDTVAEELAADAELAPADNRRQNLDLEPESDLDVQEPLENPTELAGDEAFADEIDHELADAANRDEEIPDSEAQQSAEVETPEESTEAIRARALEAELNDEDALEAIPRENLAALGFMSSPVELLAGRESRLLRNSLLLLSIVLLGGLLIGQHLRQRMELYSQLPQLRGIYETVCTRTGCELPEFSDISAIRSENLTVQTHPTFDNALMVNTVIRNTAAFEQPFPILILSFNSAENSIIALREFAPAEYLDSGLRAVQTMPSLTPVQISLAIMDPGPQAVNYTLAFRLP